MVRPLVVCRTTPASARHSVRGTFHVSAAAEISISRAAAPARRSGSQPDCTLRLPTVIWSPYAGSASAWITRTLCQSASSSSATIIGIAVRTPWPISERPVQMFTVPSGRTSSQAFGLKAAARCPRAGRENPITSEVPMVAVVCRNSRRVCVEVVMSHLRRAVDGPANPLVRPAAADIGHCRVDIVVARIGVFDEQGSRGHHLSGLAVPALWDIFRDPGALDRMTAVAGQSFDGGDRAGADRGNRRHARPGRLAAEVHGARAALRDPAAELGSGEAQRIAQHPEQRHVTGNVDAM